MDTAGTAHRGARTTSRQGAFQPVVPVRVDPHEVTRAEPGVARLEHATKGPALQLAPGAIDAAQEQADLALPAACREAGALHDQLVRHPDRMRRRPARPRRATRGPRSQPCDRSGSPAPRCPPWKHRTRPLVPGRSARSAAARRPSACRCPQRGESDDGARPACPARSRGSGAWSPV